MIREAADAALEASVVGSFTRVGFLARRWLFAWDEDPDLTGKTVVITGGTSGLGRAASIRLGSKGAHVVVVGRDGKRADTVVAAIESRGGSAEARVADLSDLKQAAALGEALSSVEIHAIAHNAGALDSLYGVTKQGFERTYATHVLAPVVINSHLVPAMGAVPGSRVITMSSGGMYAERLDVDKVEMGEDGYDGVIAYARAKRAQVVLNQVWAQRHSEVAFHAMHPGWADTPGVVTSLPQFHKVMVHLLRSPEQGADTLVWLVGEDSEELGTGRFWLDRRPRSTVKLPWTTWSSEDAEALWHKVIRDAGDFLAPGYVEP